MGIRVDAATLRQQLELTGQLDWLELPYHRGIVSGELPLSHRRRDRPVPDPDAAAAQGPPRRGQRHRLAEGPQGACAAARNIHVHRVGEAGSRDGGDRARPSDPQLRTPTRRRRHQLRGGRGRGVRLPRAQRRGQDDDDPRAHGLPAPEPRDRPRSSVTTPGARHRLPTATWPSSAASPPTSASCRPANSSTSSGRLRGLERGAWRRAGRAPGARPDRPDPQAVARQPAEGRRGPGVHGQRAAAGHGRADVRARSGHAARVPGARRRGPGGRADGLPVVPQPARSRALLRSGRDRPRRAGWSTSPPSRPSWPRTGARSTWSSGPSPHRMPSTCRTSGCSRSTARSST